MKGLVNASAESDARFREYVKAGTVLCARSIQPFERGRPVCGGRGPSEAFFSESRRCSTLR
jgi:hypothetical protein